MCYFSKSVCLAALSLIFMNMNGYPVDKWSEDGSIQKRTLEDLPSPQELADNLSQMKKQMDAMEQENNDLEDSKQVLMD